MPLVPLLPIFHRLNREHFEGSLVVQSQPVLAVRWSDGRLRKTAGFYRHIPKFLAPGKYEIVLSRPLLELLPQSALESTLCHEMIHAWIDLVLKLKESHGPHFKAKMAAINSSQSIFQVTVRHKFPVPRDYPRWWAICPKCGLRSAYFRKVQGAACKQCCQSFHGGTWHSSCLLIYEPAKRED